CKDGVVIGTDSSTTFGIVSGEQLSRTIEQPTKKIDIIGDQVIVAGTGAVGLGQRFCAIVKRLWYEKNFQTLSGIDMARHFTRFLIEDFSFTYIKPGMYGALVAFPAEKKHFLCEFPAHDLQPECKTEKIWYVSMGSSQPITDPFLAFIREVFWGDSQPTVQAGVFAVTWTLQHAIAVNPGGVNGPIRIAILARSSANTYAASILEEADLLEHRESIAAAKQRLRDFPETLKATPAEELPKP
ncbi:hypothetical protein L0244_38340, partial [bacterium]|nr:hypothetical protein [bacterium]